MLGTLLIDSAIFGTPAEPRLELVADAGGDFIRGDIGHCGVLSPDPPPALRLARGSLDTASVTGPERSCGALAADSALWIAAADGCVDLLPPRGCGRLSLRMGELLREFSGLVPDGEDEGSRLLDRCLRSCGAEDVDCDDTSRC